MKRIFLYLFLTVLTVAPSVAQVMVSIDSLTSGSQDSLKAVGKPGTLLQKVRKQKRLIESEIIGESFKFSPVHSFPNLAGSSGMNIQSSGNGMLPNPLLQIDVGRAKSMKGVDGRVVKRLDSLNPYDISG